MAEFNFKDSNYRFSDPIRFFKANDPYYFEVDNIPLKQLQENCLWLKDQLRQSTPEVQKVKRADIDELRPYATGGDRLVRVNPGRYTARVNDATKYRPLAYLLRQSGQEVGETDSWLAAVPGEGTFGTNSTISWNTFLDGALQKFKSSIYSTGGGPLDTTNSLGLNGLETRVFTWPVVNSDFAINNTGVVLDDSVSYIKYAQLSENNPGGSVAFVPTVISQAILWAKSFSSQSFPLFTHEGIESDGFAKLARTESHFVKLWRGVARTAVVDIDEELTIEVPAFNTEDFNYIDEDGNEQSVDGVQTRIDLVFIYTKPVDMEEVNILKPTGKTTITKPQLGIVKGAGIKLNLDPINNESAERGIWQPTTDEHKILACPADQNNPTLGFTATSANDLAYDVRGTFPTPDDLLNLAPLLSERLETDAIELVGQSILPVAYVWVRNEGDLLTNGSVPVQTTDVIDIRPFFRTTELAYNERAGIAAAFPQLSLANPAVGKAQLDYELRRVHKDLLAKIPVIGEGPSIGLKTVAMGYVYGGWFFGPEGTILNYFQNAVSPLITKQQVGQQMGFVNAPNYPDWDIGEWTQYYELDSPGKYAVDYINYAPLGTPETLVAGCFSGKVNEDGKTDGGAEPPTTLGTAQGGTQETILTAASQDRAIIYKKTIYFDRPSDMIDYSVNVHLINSMLVYDGTTEGSSDQGLAKNIYVAKEFNRFTIVVTNGFNILDDQYLDDIQNNRAGKANNRMAQVTVCVPPLMYSQLDQSLNSSWSKGILSFGTCYYPTVQWTMTGVYPEDSAYYGGVTVNSPSNPLNVIR